MRTAITLFFAALVVFASTAPLHAQLPAENSLTQQLLLCDDVVDLTERLTCFNVVVDGLGEEPVTALESVTEMPAADESEKLKPDVPKEKLIVVDNIKATIVRSWKNHDGRFSVELDTGEVWRETQGTRVGLPKKGVSVEISTGRWGGYRMKIGNINRIAWVRRTK